MALWYTFFSINSHTLDGKKRVQARTRHLGLCRIVVALFPACILMIGCTGSSGIRTMIHQSPNSIVYLEWVPRESFRASHPATLSPTLIRRILGGVVVQTPPGVIKAILGVEPKPSHIFSDEDVDLLLPHVVSALSQATPEEQVVFQRVYSLESESVTTAGTLHIHEDLLFLTFTHYGHKTARPTVTIYKGNRQVPDPSGLKELKVSFTPEAAWRPAAIPDPGPLGQPYTKTLAIDYNFLASLPSISFAPFGEEKIPRSPEEDVSGARKVPSPLSTRETQLEALEEKFRSLKRELSDVEVEVEELKKNQ